MTIDVRQFTTNDLLEIIQDCSRELSKRLKQEAETFTPKYVMKDYACKKCGSYSYKYMQKGPHIGMYCNCCNTFVKWVPKEEVATERTVKEQVNKLEEITICDVCKDRMYCDHSRKENDKNCKYYEEDIPF